MMALVALSWIYILLTTAVLGVAMGKLLGIENKNLPESALLGLVSVTILAGVWAFFGRINIEFQVLILVLSAISFWKFRADVTDIFRKARSRIADFPTALKMLFWPTILIILAQSAAAPFAIDNESYYIQTVKWLNEYGFVKGLANLHVFLAQCSGWHVAQSAFSFSFLYPDFNDLSGFCLLIGNWYAFQRFDDFLKSGEKLALITGLFPLLNVFLLRFSGAPSPDMAIYVISFIVADRFIARYGKSGSSDFNFLALLVLFAVYCKPSAVALVLLPLFWLFSHGWKWLNRKIVLTGFAFLVLFISKNAILSGYPLFPLSNFALSADHTLPRSIADLYYIETKMHGFRITAAEYAASDTFSLILHWATLPKLHGFFNSATLLLIVIVPFFILKFHNKKALWLLYATMLVQLAWLLYGSPQYRFFINLTMIFWLFVLACLPIKKRLLLAGFGISLAASLVLLLVPIRLDSFTDNENAKRSDRFSLNNVLFPHENSKFDVIYKVVRKGNLRYHSPVASPFFWGNGNGRLPCVNKEQLDYMERYYGIYPQLRGNSLKDGFYSQQ